MLNHIDKELCGWGRWAIRHATSGVGWPSVSPMFKDYRSSDVHRSCEPIGTLGQRDFEIIDLAVRQLPSVLRLVCIEHYQFSKNWNDSTRRLGISKKALSQYLHSAHSKVAIFLEEHKKN